MIANNTGQLALQTEKLLLNWRFLLKNFSKDDSTNREQFKYTIHIESLFDFFLNTFFYPKWSVTFWLIIFFYVWPITNKLPLLKCSIILMGEFYHNNIQTRLQKSWDTVQIVNKTECNDVEVSNFNILFRIQHRWHIKCLNWENVSF